MTSISWVRRIVSINLGLVALQALSAGFLMSGYAPLGYRRSYWLHVPIGVGIFGGLTRQANRLETV